MRKPSWRWAFLTAALVIGMTVSAKAQDPTNPIIHPTPNSNEVNLIDFDPAGFNLSTSNPNDYSVSPNNGTAGQPGGQQSILDRLYGAGNYTELPGTATQTFLNLQGITATATVKYSADNDTFGYYNPSTGAASAAFVPVVKVSGPSGGGFLSNPASGLTVTNGAGVVVPPTTSFLLTPAATGSPFQFGLFTGPNAFSPTGFFYSSNQSSALTGLTDQGDAGFNHLAVFQIGGSTSIGSVGDTVYALTWEDGAQANSPDMDYNDLVLQINILPTAIPEPSSLTLAGISALGVVVVGYVVRRRRKAAGV